MKHGSCDWRHVSIKRNLSEVVSRSPGAAPWAESRVLSRELARREQIPEKHRAGGSVSCVPTEAAQQLVKPAAFQHWNELIHLCTTTHVVEADCYCSFTQGQEDEIESGNAWATWLPYNTDRLSRGCQASGTSHLLQEDSLQAAASYSAGAAPALMAAPKTPCSDRFLPPQMLQVIIFHILFHFDLLMALGGHLTRVSGQWICHSLHLHAHQRSLPNLIHLVWALISRRAILQSNHNSATQDSQSWEQCPHPVCLPCPQKPRQWQRGCEEDAGQLCLLSWHLRQLLLKEQFTFLPQAPPFSHATCRGTMYKWHGEGMNMEQTPHQLLGTRGSSPSHIPAHQSRKFILQLRKTTTYSFLSCSTFLLLLLLQNVKCTFHIKGKRPIQLHLTRRGLFSFNKQHREDPEDSVIKEIPTQ